MNRSSIKQAITILLVGTALSVSAVRANAQTRLGVVSGAMFPIYQATSLPSSQLINPEELVEILQSPKGEKPLMIQVGSHVLYQQAHIPGSEYIGPASSGCAHGWNLFREANSSSFIADVVRGATVPTSSLPTTRCAQWASLR